MPSTAIMIAKTSSTVMIDQQLVDLALLVAAGTRRCSAPSPAGSSVIAASIAASTRCRLDAVGQLGQHEEVPRAAAVLTCSRVSSEINQLPASEASS